MNNVIEVTVRDINVITSEIRYIQNDVQLYAAQGALKIGERLCEAKELLDHGEFGSWLKNEFGWTDRTAQRLMSVYREFGNSQKNLFGPDINTTTLSDLSVSKLYLLISVPESEREQFAEENNISDISVREMEKLIREKKEAEDNAREASEALEEAEDKYRAAQQAFRQAEKENSREVEVLKKKLDGERAEGFAQAEKKWAEEVNTVKLSLRDAEKEKKEAETALQAALADAEKYKKDIEQLRQSPKVPEEIIKKIEGQFTERLRAAEEKAAKAAGELAAAESRAKLSDPTVAIFKVHFDNVQKEFVTMLSLIPQMDGETGAKMKNAVVAVLDNFRNQVK